MSTPATSFTRLVADIKASFVNKATEATALANASSHPNVIYYTSDSNKIIVGGQEYGGGSITTGSFAFASDTSAMSSWDTTKIYVTPTTTTGVLQVYQYESGTWEMPGTISMNIPDDASDVTYDPTSSGVVATNVQDALDALKDLVDEGVEGVYPELNPDTFYVTDNNYNAIAKFDKDGLTTTSVQANHYYDADGNEFSSGNADITSDYDDALIIVDNNYNAIARFDKDGLTTTSVQSKGYGFSNYQLISLGDSLSAGSAWQKVCAHALGCKYDETKERDANYPLSMPGVSNGGYAGIERVLNLFDLNIIDGDGEYAIVVIGNINDGHSGSITDSAVSCHRKVTVTGSSLSSSILSSIPSDDRVVNYVLSLSAGSTYIYIGDDLSSWTDTAKWAGIGSYMNNYRSIKTMIQAIITRYPKVHIMLAGFPSIYVALTDYLLPNGTYDNVAWYNTPRMENGRERNAMLRSIADFYTIPYLPVYEEEGITLENLNLYYYENNVHPKEEGYSHWGKIIARQIKQQF